ncbi:MAG TPA: hypothetical protein VK607_13810 [Kofleriaceae bacterium]|nr:hypothetical protein [Kofleriaceae bacterium]HMG52703.1 hypothetical protein [Kofleriaceae bacterium]
MKSMFAMLFLGALAIASAGRSTAVSAAPAPTVAPQFGDCRWYCGSKSFTTRAACQAACTNDFCEQIC